MQAIGMLEKKLGLTLADPDNEITISGPARILSIARKRCVYAFPHYILILSAASAVEIFPSLD